MNEDFEKWAMANCPPDSIYNSEDGHFWISAFVKEVIQRGNNSTDDPSAYVEMYGSALLALRRDFGLDDEK